MIHRHRGSIRQGVLREKRVQLQCQPFSDFGLREPCFALGDRLLDSRLRAEACGKQPRMLIGPVGRENEET